MALKMTLLGGKPVGKFEDKFYKVFQIEKKKFLPANKGSESISK